MVPTAWRLGGSGNREADARPSKKKEPGLMTALQELLCDATAGDPISGLRWTHKTAQKLTDELRHLGFPVGRTTVTRLLRQGRYSLRTNRKRLAGTQE